MCNNLGSTVHPNTSPNTTSSVCWGNSKIWRSLGVFNLGWAYILIPLQTPYQVFIEEIHKFWQSLGVSSLGWAYILIYLQTPYQVFGKEILKFQRSLGVSNLGWAYINPYDLNTSNILGNAATPTLLVFSHLCTSQPLAGLGARRNGIDI